MTCLGIVDTPRAVYFIGIGGVFYAVVKELHIRESGMIRRVQERVGASG